MKKSGRVTGLLALAIFAHLWWRAGGASGSGPFFVAPKPAAWNLALIALFFANHSLLATRALKRRAGWDDARYRRFYLVENLLLVALVWALWAPPVDSAQAWWSVSLPFSLPFFAAQAVGLAGFLWTTSRFDLKEFFGAESAREPRLSSEGPFALCRHPSYLFGMLLMLSPQMPAGRGWLTAAACAYMMLGSLFEERKLLEAFGPVYARYRAETPWLFPSPKSLKRALS